MIGRFRNAANAFYAAINVEGEGGEHNIGGGGGNNQGHSHRVHEMYPLK
jgi:hypothetical protein